jgi:hypothetical protein
VSLAEWSSDYLFLACGVVVIPFLAGWVSASIYSVLKYGVRWTDKDGK